MDKRETRPPRDLNPRLKFANCSARITYSVHIKRRRWTRCREAEQNGGRGATAGHVTNNHTNVQANVPNVYNLGSSAFNRDVLPLFHVPGGEPDPPLFFSFFFSRFFFFKRISSAVQGNSVIQQRISREAVFVFSMIRQFGCLFFEIWRVYRVFVIFFRISLANEEDEITML